MPIIGLPTCPAEAESGSSSGAQPHLTLPPESQSPAVEATAAAVNGTPASDTPIESPALDEHTVDVSVPSMLDSSVLAEMMSVAARFLAPAPTTLELVATLRMPVPRTFAYRPCTRW